MTGAFVAVVGPSGAGKDAVIGWARDALTPRAGEFVFPRRVVTRPAGPGEDHVPVDEAGFARIERAGGFALAWRAHGLAYGVPAAVIDAVRGGAVAVVNLSRGILPELADRFGRSYVVRISVSEDVRRARIAARGRESTADADARLNRADPAPDFPVDLEIVNDGALAEAGAALTTFLQGVRGPITARSR